MDKRFELAYMTLFTENSTIELNGVEYKLLRILGEGCTSVVLQVLHLCTAQEFALKIVSSELIAIGSCPDYLLQKEMKFIQTHLIQHPLNNIVQFHACITKLVDGVNYHCILMECFGESLKTFLSSPRADLLTVDNMEAICFDIIYTAATLELNNIHHK